MTQHPTDPTVWVMGRQEAIDNALLIAAKSTGEYVKDFDEYDALVTAGGFMWVGVNEQTMPEQSYIGFKA